LPVENIHSIHFEPEQDKLFEFETHGNVNRDIESISDKQSMFFSIEFASKRDIGL